MHTVVGKLNEDANEFQAGEYTGFGFRLGERYFDRETKSNEWTNYKAVVFSNNANQINFLRDALVKGAIVQVSGESIKIERFTGQNGQEYLTLELNHKLNIPNQDNYFYLYQ